VVTSGQLIRLLTSEDKMVTEALMSYYCCVCDLISLLKVEEINGLSCMVHADAMMRKLQV